MILHKFNPIKRQKLFLLRRKSVNRVAQEKHTIKVNWKFMENSGSGEEMKTRKISINKNDFRNIIKHNISNNQNNVYLFFDNNNNKKEEEENRK